MKKLRDRSANKIGAKRTHNPAGSKLARKAASQSLTLRAPRNQE